MSQDTSKENGDLTADMISNRLRSLMAQRGPQQEVPPDEIPEGFPMTGADIRRKFGFDPNDPNVTVKVIPLGGAAELLGRMGRQAECSGLVPEYESFLKGLTHAIDGEPVGNTQPKRSRAEITADLIDVARRIQALSAEIGVPMPDELTDALAAYERGLPDEDTAASEVAAAAAAAEVPEQRVKDLPYVGFDDEETASVFAAVRNELARARSKHDNMHSPHEGSSIIREEFEELWEHVLHDTGFSAGARKEATQLAAMAIRYLIDLNPAL